MRLTHTLCGPALSDPPALVFAYMLIWSRSCLGGLERGAGLGWEGGGSFLLLLQPLAVVSSRKELLQQWPRSHSLVC